MTRDEKALERADYFLSKARQCNRDARFHRDRVQHWNTEDTREVERQKDRDLTQRGILHALLSIAEHLAQDRAEREGGGR